MMEMLWYPQPGLLLHLRAPRPADRGCLFSAAWLGPSLGLCRVGGAAASPGGCKAPSWGWEEDGRDARGLIALFFSPPPPCPLTIPLSHPARSPPGLLLGRSLSPQLFWDHLPRRDPSTIPQTSWRGGLTPGSASRDGRLQGGSKSTSPLPRRGPLHLGVAVPPLPIHVGG